LCPTTAPARNRKLLTDARPTAFDWQLGGGERWQNSQETAGSDMDAGEDRTTTGVAERRNQTVTISELSLTATPTSASLEMTIVLSCARMKSSAVLDAGAYSVPEVDA
jgi:hypothetical protein